MANVFCTAVPVVQWDQHAVSHRKKIKATRLRILRLYQIWAERLVISRQRAYPPSPAVLSF